MPFGEDDVHRPEQQPIGQFTAIGHIYGEHRLADAEKLGERRIACHDFGGGSQQFYGSRAHELSSGRTPSGRFWIGRPRNKSASAAFWENAHQKTVPEETARLVTDKPAPRQGPKRVLVVDDHPDSAESFSKILALLGHEARFLLDPFDVLPTVRAFKPDIVFLDIAMPGLNGHELARALRAQFGPDQLCLVAVTAHTMSADRKKSREAGFDAHVGKPLDYEIIESILKTLG